MSERLAPILDWIETHAPTSRWQRPPPVPDEALASLTARGAPAELVALYEHGAHAPGAFPRGSAGEDHLLPPSEVHRAQERAGWVFSGAGSDGAWLVEPGGRAVKVRLTEDQYDEHDELVEVGGHVDVGAPTTLDRVLDQHLTALQDGVLTWNDPLGCFLYPDERPDLAWLDDLDEHEARSVTTWITKVRTGLVTDDKVVIEGFGSFTLSVRRAFHGVDAAPQPSRRIPVFRAAKELKDLLNGRADELTLQEPLLLAIAAALQANKRVGLPGLGCFTVSKRQSFTGHNPRTGKPMIVPSVSLPVFRSWRTLRTAVNPHLG